MTTRRPIPTTRWRGVLLASTVLLAPSHRILMRTTTRARLRVLGVLILMLAMLLNPFPYSASAQGSDFFLYNGQPVPCSGPTRIAQGCILGNAGIYEIEQQSIAQLLQAHSLPPEHAARLLKWERSLIRSVMFDKLLAVIKKAPAARSASEQELIDTVAGLVRQKRLDSATFSRTEYTRWMNDPCHYAAPTGFTYNIPTTCASPIGGLLGGPPPPSLQEFQNYGIAHTYNEYQNNPELQQIAGLTAKDIGLLSGFAAAGVAGVVGGVIGANLAAGGVIIGAIHPFLATALFGTSLTPGVIPAPTIAAANAVASGVVGATSIAAVAAIVVAAVVIGVMQGINVFEASAIPGKLDAAVTAAQATPDLASVIGTDAGLREVYSIFIAGTVPENPAPSLLSPAVDAPVPAAQPTDRQVKISGAALGTQFVNSFEYKDWQGKALSARLNDGWFVINANGVERLSLSIDYVDPDGKGWTAWRVGNEFLEIPAADTVTPSYKGNSIIFTRPNGFITNLVLVPANLPPSFTPGGNITLNEDAGAYSAAWATNVSANDGNFEPSQAVTFQLSATVPNPNGISVGGVPATKPADYLFSQQPAINATGRLTFTLLKPNANGAATISVRAKDTGGTIEGGQDTSAAVSFTLTINPIADPPFVPAAPATITTNENAPVTASIASLGVNDSADEQEPATRTGIIFAGLVNSLATVTAPQKGTVAYQTGSFTPNLTYTPNPNAFGADSFVYQVCDTGYPSSSCANQTVNVTINKVNSPPSFTPGPSVVTVAEDSGTYSAPWATNMSSGPGESDPLSFLYTYDNEALFSQQPTISLSDGRLSFTPAPNASGSATISVVLIELDPFDAFTSGSYNITINVTPVDDPPTVAVDVTGTLGQNGWYTSDVTVKWNVADSDSSSISQSGCAPTTITADTSGTTLTCAATSDGKTTSQSVTIKRDTTKPIVTAAAVNLPNAAGWYNVPVRVRYTCTDTLSGIAADGCLADQILSSEGVDVRLRPVYITDQAGNASGPSNSLSLKIDRTAPTLAPTISKTPVRVGDTVTASANASDTLSGIASQSCAALDTSMVGVKSVSCTTTDMAGNTASASVSYTVLVAFPTTGVLETFDRANGGAGTSWDGLTGTSFYQIASNKLDVQLGGPLVWKPTSFGTSQEAFVTLSTIDTRSPAQGVLLKVQSGSLPNAGAISVVYDALTKTVRVSTLRLGTNGAWTLYTGKAATFANGDVLGARAKANGDVQIYKNGALITTVILNTTDQSFFNTKGGKIGLWTVAAPNALFDGFGGGTATP